MDTDFNCDAPHVAGSLNPKRQHQYVKRSVRLALVAVSVSETEMIVNTTRITVPADKRMEFIQTIGRLLEPSKRAKGCRTFEFYLDASDENSTLLVSEWDTETDLNNYLRSDDFSVLKGAITVLSARSTDSRASVTSYLNIP